MFFYMSLFFFLPQTQVPFDGRPLHFKNMEDLGLRYVTLGAALFFLLLQAQCAKGGKSKSALDGKS